MREGSILARAVLLVVGAAAAAAAGDRRVPSRYRTIQAAIDAAAPRDRVLVAPGRYPERIVFKGVPLTVESEQGPEKTIIDGRGHGPVVTFDPRDGVFTLLAGFTITGGRAEGDRALGAGVYCPPGASPLIAHNIIAGNETRGTRMSLGGGLYASGRPVVVGNEIRDNRAVGRERTTEVGGGGLFATGGWFLGNRITGNTVIANRNVSEPVLYGRGGGADLAGPVDFVGNQVSGNATCLFGLIGTGGGLHLDGAPFVALNVIHHNTASATVGRGGGIHCGGRSRPLLFGNVILENSVHADMLRPGNAARGGGVYCQEGSTPDLRYNTIVGNRVSGSTGEGAGLMAHRGAPTLIGCLLWNNVHWRDGRAVRVCSLAGVKLSSVRRCLVGDGQFSGQNGNFRADPRLADRYHLAPDSPCIDAGEVTAAPPLSVDIDDGDRVLDGRGTGRPRIDVGADEYAPLAAARLPGSTPATRPRRIELVLRAPALAGRGYRLAASFGSNGIALPPPDPRRVPLRLDALFRASFGARAAPFPGFAGVLDGKGEARAAIDLPAAGGLAGLTIHVAGVVIDRAAIRLVTNGVALPGSRGR